MTGGTWGVICLHCLAALKEGLSKFINRKIYNHVVPNAEKMLCSLIWWMGSELLLSVLLLLSVSVSSSPSFLLFINLWLIKMAFFVMMVFFKKTFLAMTTFRRLMMWRSTSIMILRWRTSFDSWTRGRGFALEVF